MANASESTQHPTKATLRATWNAVPTPSRRACLEDLLAVRDVRLVDVDLPVEAPRAHQRRVQDVRAVRPRQHLAEL